MSVAKFFDALDREQLETHAAIVLQRGRRVGSAVWRPYSLDRPHVLYSLSKSFTSTAAGFAIAEGKFNLDLPVLEFFPDEAPNDVSDNLRTMRVRDLLAMATGHADEPNVRDSEDWARGFLSWPVSHAPGTHFLYNSLATYMVSAIVQRTTGENVLAYLRPRLFDPLGIVNATWEQCPKGVDVGGWGLSLSVEDIAKFGQLYLDGGRDILPQGWVAEATRAHVDNSEGRSGDWAQGYGFQFWRCSHDAYRGDGAFGQFCIVIPEHQIVVAITGGGGDMQKTLDLVWANLLHEELEAVGDREYALPAAIGEAGPEVRWRLWDQELQATGDTWTESRFQLPGYSTRSVAARSSQEGDVVKVKVVDLDSPWAAVLTRHADGRVTTGLTGVFGVTEGHSTTMPNTSALG